MFKKKMVILVGLILGLFGIVLLIVLTNRSPVLIRIPNPDSVRGRPLFLLLNPFRDKVPETVAESFFEKLRDGKCLEATVGFADEKANRICQKQIEYPLKMWNLIDVERKHNTFRLIYRHISENHPWGEDMTIWIEKQGQDYRVTAFVIGY